MEIEAYELSEVCETIYRHELNGIEKLKNRIETLTAELKRHQDSASHVDNTITKIRDRLLEDDLDARYYITGNKTEIEVEVEDEVSA